MSHLTNAQIFKAIGLDDSVNPSSKYTLLICAHVLMDWKAWSGHISADQLALATNQSSRGVQRHLKTLVEAGWLFRHAEVRGPGLHHKSFTILNQDKVREVLKRAHDTTELVKPDTTELVSVSPKVSSTSWSTDTTELVKPDTTELADAKNDTPDTTELVKPDTTELVRPALIETELTKSVVVDTTELAITTTELVSDSPNLSYISIHSNNTQYKPIEPEPEPEPRVKRGILEDGFEWCERCKQNVSMDEPHTYPHSTLICSDDQPTPEEVSKAMEWDRAWGAPEVKVSSEVKRGDLFYLDEIHDELNYKREVFDILNDYGRHDVRLCLWNRQDGDKLFKEMMEAKIAPRSVIDWVTVYYGGEATGDTPSKPKPPTSFKVTVEQQQKILEADRAWLMNGQTNNGDSNTW
jgi:hypothetical protein